MTGGQGDGHPPGDMGEGRSSTVGGILGRFGRSVRRPRCPHRCPRTASNTPEVNVVVSVLTAVALVNARARVGLVYGQWCAGKRGRSALHDPARRRPAKLPGWICPLGDDRDARRSQPSIGLRLAEADGTAMLGLIRGHVVNTLAIADPEPMVPSGLWNQRPSDDERESAIEAARRAEFRVARPGCRMLIQGASGDSRDRGRVNQCRCSTAFGHRSLTNRFDTGDPGRRREIPRTQLRESLGGRLSRCLPRARSAPLTIEGRISRCGHGSTVIRARAADSVVGGPAS
jgi:hypothetical protein